MIIVFGSINLDIIFSLPKLPKPGETLITGGSRVEPGGKGANQAAAAALDGAIVHMAGAVGRDALADAALTCMKAAGVDLTRVIRAEATTGCASIATDADGHNQIIVAPGANLAARADQVEDALLGPGSILLTQMEVDPAETGRVIVRAKARGARTLLNLAPAKAIEPATLQAVDLLVVNEAEAAFLGSHLATGADAASLHKALGIGVLRTLGAEGAEAVTADTAGRIFVPARQIRPVDSTAAGDCFTGVLASALNRGAPLEAAMQRASTAAALSCLKPGSQGSLPGHLDTDKALAG
jgi:ribokinase